MVRQCTKQQEDTMKNRQEKACYLVVSLTTQRSKRCSLTEIQYPPKYPIWDIKKKFHSKSQFFFYARAGTNLRKSGNNNGRNAVGGI